MTNPNAANRWDPASYQSHTGFVAQYGEDVLTWLELQPGERVLDLGCGDGVLTEKLVEAGGRVIGVDQSEEFVAAARARGIDARVGDAAALTFNADFDAVFTNAALHWVPDATGVASGVRKALVDGGRFVGEFGGFGNVATIASALRAVASRHGVDANAAAPWFNPRPEAYAALLERHGFAVLNISHFARPTPLPTGLEGWLSVMRATFLDQFGDAREDALREVVDACEPSLRAADGTWYADYVRLRFRALAV